MNLRNLIQSEAVRLPLLVIITLVVGLAAITNQSFWMDESNAAVKAVMPTFQDWKFFFFRLGGSDVQMPFYMLALWFWHKLGLVSEYGLRCINLPFLVLMVLALRRVKGWPLVCLCSPFVLYYVGELRPYTMQMAGGALAALGLTRVQQPSDGKPYHGLHTTACAAFLLVLSSLTAAVWAAGLALALIILRPEWLTRPGFWLRCAPWLAVATALSAYYGYTLLQGYRATSSGGGGLLSIGFGLYEIFGFLGLGPSREELRISSTAILPSLPWLVPAALIVGTVWLCGVSTWFKTTSGRQRLAVAAACILPILILGAIGHFANFRVLGRHISPAIPAVLLPIALVLQQSLRSKSFLSAAGLAALLLATTSSINLRLLPKHARYDYRTASEIAIRSLLKGEQIRWMADMNSIRYYAFRAAGLPLVMRIQELESSPPSFLMADLVFVNRPEISFQGRNYRKELTANGFHLLNSFSGFEIWKNRISTD